MSKLSPQDFKCPTCGCKGACFDLVRYSVFPYGIYHRARILLAQCKPVTDGRGNTVRMEKV